MELSNQHKVGGDGLKAIDKKDHASREKSQRQMEGARVQVPQSPKLGRFQLPRLTTSRSVMTSSLHVPSPPQSPAAVTAKSPRLQRRRKSTDLDSTQEGGLEVESPRNRANSSSQLLSAKTGDQYATLRSSPKLLRRRQTAGSVATTRGSMIGVENLNSSFPPRRRQSGEIVPIIQINESAADDLQERVRTFNKTLEQCATKLRKSSRGVDVRQGDDESPETSDDQPTTPRLPIHRSRSLPSLLPVLNTSDLKKDSEEPLSFYEDLRRCRYLRIPGSPKPLTVEEIFQKN